MGCMSLFLRIFIPLIVFPALSCLLPLYEIFKLVELAWRSFFFSCKNLDGKVALITGAASGIGEQLAYEYAKRGARLALIDINEDRLREISDRARKIGSPDVMWVKANVSDFQESENFIKQTVERFGQLDHLVNNAGILKPFGLFEDVTDTCTLRPIMETNFWGSIYSTHYAIPHLRQSKGQIISIASSIGHYPSPNTSIYNASKAALISFYETLRVELGPEVGITIVTPGPIDTPMIRGQFISIMGLGKYLPSTSPEETAKEIVRGGCRGDEYVKIPYWVSVFMLLKALYPELATCLSRFFFLRKDNSRFKRL